MTLIDKKKREAFIRQYEQLINAMQHREGNENSPDPWDIEMIMAGKEELERVFNQYQLQYNELQYLVSRYETLHKNMRLKLRSVKVRIGRVN